MILTIKFSDSSEIEFTQLQFDEIRDILKKKNIVMPRNSKKDVDYFCSRIIDDLRIKPATQSILINRYRKYKELIIEAINKLESTGVVKVNESFHKYSGFKIRLVSLA